ncbi:MAG: type I-C CRISPR-associated protein Cas5c [Bacteroidales bacterium]|nr:type I-C CRISPR-associated protein Cas5c [Bacteroidales bacterium]
MEYNDREYCLEVWGDIACFTRSEFKVERMSYDVITPSAARAIFEAILFKKYAMRWQITKIEVLNEIKWTSVRRNEVGATAGKRPIYIEEKRQQRNTLMLRDVRYRLWAKLVFIPVNARPEEAFAKHKPGEDENPMKYYEMFERRASQGQCFTQPYLGTRECVASFKLVNPERDEMQPTIGDNRDLGIMLYDLDFSKPKSAQALFYHPIMNKGVIIVPPINSKDILR